MRSLPLGQGMTGACDTRGTAPAEPIGSLPRSPSRTRPERRRGLVAASHNPARPSNRRLPRSGPLPCAPSSRRLAAVERLPLPRRALRDVLVLAALATLATALVSWSSSAGGTTTAPPWRPAGTRRRGTRCWAHPGTGGLAFGIAGSALMLVMQAYSVRKKWKRLGRLGKLPHWLEFHIFCGVLGPVLITFHTSFKFNGIVSVAYWSMVLVVASGFVGRYLYVRIPKTIRGTEVTLEEVGERSRELRSAASCTTSLPPALVRGRGASRPASCRPGRRRPTWRGIVFGELTLRCGLRSRRSAVRAPGRCAPEVLHTALSTVRRARRAAPPHRLPQADQEAVRPLARLPPPLAYLMLVIVTLHVATAVYFGYALAR